MANDQATNIETLFKSQQSLRDQMTKFIANTKKTAIIKRTHGFYIARINGWHDLWRQYLENEEKISQLKSAENLQNPYFSEDHFAVQEQLFYEYKGELVDNLEKLEREGKSKSSSPGNTTNNTESNISAQTNLPRIALPKFSGDYNDWVSFRDLFISVIHENTNLQDVQKLHYLKTTLIGEAAHVVKQFSITNANYQSAWSALTQRYENNRVLVSTILKTFTSQQKITSESATSIKNLLNVTNECLSSLTNLKINTLHWDPLIIHLLVQKLPSETHKAWEESIGDSTEIPSWKEFEKFLELRFRTLEAISGIKSKTSVQPDKRTDSCATKVKVQTFHAAQISCSYCKDDHSLRTCPKFLKMDARAKLRTAKASGCCVNCLGKYHSINKCLSTSRCSECGGKHHSLLHNSFSKHNTFSHFNKEKKIALQETQSPQPQPSTSNVLAHFSSETRHVLLATAIVYIQTHDGLHVTRALIDPGSQATFITNSALRRMKIATSKTLVKISGLGNTKTASSQRMANITIRNLNGDINIDVNVIALDTLTDLLPSHNILNYHWEHIKGLNLADPTFFKPNKIDIIIGADIYPLILRDGVKTGTKGTPVAQNTIFGWVLSGEISPNSEPKNKIEVISLINTLDINQNLKRFWELEEVSNIKRETPEDIACEQLYRTTHYRKSDGSYVVRLPFKPTSSENILGSSRSIAEKRLLSVEKTAGHRGFLQEYVAC